MLFRIGMFFWILTSFSWVMAMGEVIREPYLPVTENIQLFSQLQKQWQSAKDLHLSKIKRTQEMKNILPERNYKEIISRHQQQINELEESILFTINDYYDLKYKRALQERGQPYTNTDFGVFLKSEIERFQKIEN